MREKLIEVMKDTRANAAWHRWGYEESADHLIANGVTIPVLCKDCKHWHEETGWCNKHSHFIGFDGMACHPSQSSEWKMFDPDYFCKDGERKDNEND